MILSLGFIIQVITSIFAVGVSNFDQLFSIVELSSYQTGHPSGATNIWEFSHHVRPTIQVYLFSGFHNTCEFLKITDPYLQLTILRVVIGAIMFFVFNVIFIHYSRNTGKKIFYWGLLILNFSWMLPYTRTLFSSEMISSLFFFGTIFLYDLKRFKQPSLLYTALIGFLLAMSFYFRFQTGFAIAGFGIWMLFFEKKYSRFLPMAAGFMAGILVNMIMDHGFYHEWVFTPYTYYHLNIVEGFADANYGTSSFMRYVLLLIAVMTIPPFSIILFWYFLKGSVKNYKHYLVLSVLLFIIGHSLVGHKEERFLYPVFNVLPVIICWGMIGFENFYSTTKRWIRNSIKTLFAITLLFNSLMLVLMITTPYSQTIYFSYLLKNKFEGQNPTIYCLFRTPWQTISRFNMVFYQKGLNMDLKTVLNNDSVQNLQGNDIYVATEFNQVRKDRKMFDSLGYKPILYSSEWLWKLNEFLDSKDMNTINDIWVLYRKGDR